MDNAKSMMFPRNTGRYGTIALKYAKALGRLSKLRKKVITSKESVGDIIKASPPRFLELSKMLSEAEEKLKELERKNRLEIWIVSDSQARLPLISQ
jgi:hypothetical protein